MGEWLPGGEGLAPWLTVVRLPALVHAVVVVVRDVDMDKVDASGFALGRKANNQRRVGVALLERTRAPRLHDQPARYGLQHPPPQRTAEGTEVRPGPGADDDLSAGDGSVRLRAEVHGVQGLRGCGENYRLLDDLGHDVLLIRL